MKKVFSISIVFLGITLLFLGTYFLVFRKESKNPTVNEEKRTESREESDREFTEGTKQSDIAVITTERTVAAAALDESHLGYFSDRSLKRSTLGGGGEETLVANLPGEVLDAVWSPDRKQVLTRLGNDQGSRWHLVRLSDASVVPLKTGVRDPAWSNLSERIYYSYTDPVTNKSELDTSKPDGTDWKKVSTIAFPASFRQMVPASTLFSFWSRPSAFEETSLIVIPVTGGETKRIFSGKFGADYLWSPDGSHILVSNTLSKGGREMRLGIANRDGGEFRTLQAPTMVSKAVWSKDGKTIYYALPLSIPDDAVLPNDYYSRPIHTADTFWKMDVSTGKGDRIVTPESIGDGFDSSSLFLDENEEYLFFTDRGTGLLYRIRLKGAGS